MFNTWRWDKGQQKRLGPDKPLIEVPGDTTDPKAKRLDYIFASSGSSKNPNVGWVVKRAQVGMVERHPILQCSLSDHFSVEATLTYYTSASSPETPSGESGPLREDKGFKGLEDGRIRGGGFLESPAPSIDMSQSSTRAQTSMIDYGSQLNILNSPLRPLSTTTYDEILQMIEKYKARERRQRRLRLSHFVLSVLVSTGCLVAVWFVPRNFVAFILMLISTLGLGAGIFDGLIGCLFVGQEIRALKEFEWEIWNAKGRVEIGGGPTFAEGVVDW